MNLPTKIRPSGKIYKNPNYCPHEDIEDCVCKICGYSISELEEERNRVNFENCQQENYYV